jgi:hypothetical protein
MTATNTGRLPRGIRNNNPGNIRKGDDPWQGLATDGKVTDTAFCVFTDPTWGVRALARVLIRYQDKHNIRTIRDIIYRWAPPIENDTTSYVNAVCRAAGKTAGEIVDMHRYQDLRPVVEAIIRHENGAGPMKTENTWYDAATIDTGLQRAGVVKTAPVVAKVPVTKETVAATGTAGLGVGQLADVAPQIATALGSQQDHLSSGSWVRIMLGVATIGLAAYIAWSQVKKHQNGVVA